MIDFSPVDFVFTAFFAQSAVIFCRCDFTKVTWLPWTLRSTSWYLHRADESWLTDLWVLHLKGSRRRSSAVQKDAFIELNVTQEQFHEEMFSSPFCLPFKTPFPEKLTKWSWSRKFHLERRLMVVTGHWSSQILKPAKQQLPWSPTRSQTLQGKCLFCEWKVANNYRNTSNEWGFLKLCY